MSVKKADIHCKVPFMVKKKAALIFSKLGINQTTAINMFLNQVIEQKGLPFKVSIPNKETIEAIEEGMRDYDKLESYSSVKELLDSLNDDS